MTQPTTRPRPLEGAHLLVVEDDFIILLDLEATLSDAGAEAVHLARSVGESLALARTERLDAALLDIRIGDETAAPIARELSARDVPFAFYSGQTEADPVRTEWPERKIVAKPAEVRNIIAAVVDLLRP